MPFALEPYRVEIPAIERWLAGQAKPFIVAEVPVGNPRNFGQWEQREATYMLHSTAHWQKTVHGYSGFRPALHQTLYAELAEFPSEQSVRHLIDLGVTDVIVHTDLYPPEDWPVIEQRIAGFGDRLTLKHVEGDGRVYGLRHRDDMRAIGCLDRPYITKTRRTRRSLRTGKRLVTFVTS